MNLIPRRQKDVWISPFQELELLQNEMNRLFDFSLEKQPVKSAGFFDGALSPAIDIVDGKDSITVTADLPGLKKDDIEVTVQGDALLIKGEKKQEEKSESKGVIRSERFYGTFSRLITLPAGVDANTVKASYKDGVLELVLPKKEEAKPKQITVEVK